MIPRYNLRSAALAPAPKRARTAPAGKRSGQARQGRRTVRKTRPGMRTQISRRRPAPGRKPARAICTLQNGLSLKKCTNPAFSKGVFADRPFVESEIITSFEGDLLTPAEGRSQERCLPHDARRRIYHKDDCWIKGTSKPGQGVPAGSFIQDGYSALLPGNVTLLSEQEEGQPTVYCQAKSSIQKGDELFVDLGDGYWDTLKQDDPDFFRNKLSKQIRHFDRSIYTFARKTLPAEWKDYFETHHPEVPHYPGLKRKPRKWSESLIRYALFKSGIKGGDVLNAEALKQLKPDSEQYFHACAHFVFSLMTPDHKQPDRLDTVYKLPVPANGVFITTDEWQAEHLTALKKYLEPGMAIAKGSELHKLSYCLKVLNPDVSLFETVLHCYFQNYIDKSHVPVKLDTANKEHFTYLKKLQKNLRSIPLPRYLGGQAFREKYQSSGQCNWSFEAIKAFLEYESVEVKLTGALGKRGRLHGLATSSEDLDLVDYHKKLKELFERNRYDLKRIVRKDKCKRFKAFNYPWIKHSDRPATAAEALVSYINFFGFDHPGLLTVGIKHLYQALELFDPEAEVDDEDRAQNQKLIRQLVSLVVTLPDGREKVLKRQRFKEVVGPLIPNYEELLSELIAEGDALRSGLNAPGQQ